MNPLESLDPEELISLSDVDFQEAIRRHARAKTSDAMNTIENVMNSSDDDQARLLAAGKILKIAKAEEEDEKRGLLGSGVSEEVMALALAGFAKLASIAAEGSPQAILRNVTPAQSDPRPFIPDDSPLNTRQAELQAMQENEKGLLIEENLQEET